MPGYIVFDTETNGLMDYDLPADAPGQPRIADFGAILLDRNGEIEAEYQRYVRPIGWSMPPEATEVHGLTDEFLEQHGIPINAVLDFYETQIIGGRAVVGFAAQMDLKMMRAEYRHAGRDDLFEKTPNVCLMRAARPLAKQIGRTLIKHGFQEDGVTPVSQKGWPKLSDLCAFLNVTQGKAHDALEDARTTAACFRAMLDLGFEPKPEVHRSKNYEAIKAAV